MSDKKPRLLPEINGLAPTSAKHARATTVTPSLEKMRAGQKQIKALETHHNNDRRSPFDAQDEIDRQRTEFIDGIQGERTQQMSVFTIRWSVD